jgi:hypothetical protein
VETSWLAALNSVGANGRHRAEITHDPRERSVRELAGRQAGHLDRRQLLSLGFSDGAIKARVRNGTLVTRHRGVYAIAPARTDPPALAYAAVLAGGPDAVASHTSAGWLWGFITHWQLPPQISLPIGDRRPRHIRTHRCPSLQPRDITRQHGVPTTTRARTLLDLAPSLTHAQLTRLVHDERREGRVRQPALADIVARNPLHPGTKLLRPFADDPTNPTNSDFEDAFRAFITKYDLPTPEINIDLARKQADVYFPHHGLIVELDGWGFHNTREAFEEDRERDAENLRHGRSTIRITRERFDTTPDREAARLHEILKRLEKR